MEDEKIGSFIKLSMDAFEESVSAEPKVSCTEEELFQILHDLSVAVNDKAYIPQTATRDNPSLSDDYIFNDNDESLILLDLTKANFVAKIKDIGKGAKNRIKQGLPQEYLYVFKYPCKLARRDAQESGIDSDRVLIYIKINVRKVPYKKVFIISFHKNRPGSS